MAKKEIKPPTLPLFDAGPKPLDISKGRINRGRMLRIGAGVLGSIAIIGLGLHCSNDDQSTGYDVDDESATTLVKVGPGDTLYSLSNEQADLFG